MPLIKQSLLHENHFSKTRTKPSTPTPLQSSIKLLSFQIEKVFKIFRLVTEEYTKTTSFPGFDLEKIESLKNKRIEILTKNLLLSLLLSSAAITKCMIEMYKKNSNGSSSTRDFTPINLPYFDPLD